MIDSHTHLYFPEYGEEIDDVVTRCKAAGVNALILPNVDQESIQEVKEFHNKYPDYTYMAMGLHPTEVKDDWQQVIDIMEEELKSGQYVAIGEAGIDLHWRQDNLTDQQAAFERQLLLAEKFHLPVIIHSRDAVEETIEIISKVKPTVPLVFHSFTGTKENVIRIREVCDPYFGINGVVTYKNAPALREALTEIGIDRVILETDAPYLTPVPHRGKRNDSSYMPYILHQVAETLGIPENNLDTITEETTRRIFKI